MDVNAQVLDALKASDKPMKAGDIATKIGADKKEVDKALKSLKAADKIMSPKNCFYAPK